MSKLIENKVIDLTNKNDKEMIKELEFISKKINEIAEKQNTDE